MRQRSTASGRPVGTDGSDFSYRMVVESRYTRVGKGKSRLCALIMTQAVFYVVGLIHPVLKMFEDSLNKLAVSSAAVGLISLVVGEIGRRKSRVNLLRAYLFASSVAVILSIVFTVQSKFFLQILQRPSKWKTLENLELLEIACIFTALLVQISVVVTTRSLIVNMCPPKRAY